MTTSVAIRRARLCGDNMQHADTDLKRLYRWQEYALDAWIANKGKGIIEGMTGTGKTKIAFNAIKRLVKNQEWVSPLIVVPTIALLNQWYENLVKEFPSEVIGRIGDGWNDDFSSARGRALPLACIATIHSAVSAVERGIFDHCGRGKYKSLLIADECHRYINEDQKLFNRILRRDYDYTLGLSATVDRFEVPGLGKIVYTYDINAAVRDGVIPHFDVLNLGLDLSSQERAEYLELGERISSLQRRLKDCYPELEFLDGDYYWGALKRMLRDDEDPLVSALFGCIFKRAAISYTAIAKMKLVPQIIDFLVNRAQRKMLVFFERIWTAEVGQDDVVRRVAEQIRDALVDENNDDPIWCKLFHSQMKDVLRDAVLNEFRSIGPSALLACRALDEGLDIPAVDAALLVASTQSPRQRLQRIGRTLRRGDGNKRPLIVIMYVNGTSDVNVRIEANDPAFGQAATVYDAGSTQCMERMAEILGMAAPRIGLTAYSHAASAGHTTVDDVEWELIVGGDKLNLDDVYMRVTRLARRTRLKLELRDGRIVYGHWQRWMDGVLMLDTPTVQIGPARIVRIWKAKAALAHP